MSQRGFDLIRSLQIFATTAQAGSMSAAARTLSLSQSAVSQQIKHLEESVGATLFDRGLRPMRLTPAGDALSDRAVKLLAGAHEALATATRAAGKPRQVLRNELLPKLRSWMPWVVSDIRIGDD